MLDLALGGNARRTITAALIAALASLSPLAAVTAPPIGFAKKAPERMVDARVNLEDSYRRATAARPGAAAAGLSLSRQQSRSISEAAAELKRTAMPGLELRLSPFTGAPAWVANRAGALTAAAPGRDSESIVRNFLRQNGAIYGLSTADVNDLVALGDSPGSASGLRMLRMEQQIGGRPIFQSESRFLIDRNGRLVKTIGQMVPSAKAITPQFDAKDLLSPAQAITRLLESTGKSANPGSFSVIKAEGGRFLLSENDDTAAGDITAREVLFPLGPGLLVPAWSLVVFTEGEQDWYAMVDALTGDVLWRKNIRNYVSTHQARFRVYVQADGKTPADNPAPQSPNTVTPGSGTQFPEIAPTIVNMLTVQDPVASPNGWIDDCPGGVCTANETQTLGNNTITCLDQAAPANVCDTGAATVLDGNGRPTGNPDANSRNRDFLGTAPRDFQTGFLPPPQGGNPEAGQTATGNGNNGTLAIDQFRRGMVTHLFYLTNWYHDQLFSLGFDEASANFQQINFTGMGLGGDRVLGDAADGSGTNNANFGTPPDGTSGRMQMFRFTGPTIDRDGSLDAEIVLHELSHGTSNRLVGNAAGLNWDPATSMGEGWSDFYALSLLNNTNADTPSGQFASGGYATYKLIGGYLDNYLYGIRRFPYSTVNTVNPLTWADIDDVTNNLSGGIAPTPVSFNLNGGMEVHNAGELWALSLWEMRSRIIADPAGANGNVPTGNVTALRLVTDGLKMTPVDPGFIDARDALFDADCATNTCANEQWIWEGFADRGLGYKADIPYNVLFAFIGSHLGVKESFSLPYLDVVDPATDVTINDSASNNNGSIDAGEAVQLTVELTNPWRAASKGVASATATLTTSTPGVTIFDGTSTYGAIAAQGSATGDPFLITVDTSVTCGSAIDFTLTTTSSLGTTSTTFQLRVGGPSGTGAPVTYTGDPSPNLAIPDIAPRGVFHQINITDDFVISDVNFRVDSVTHTFTGDLTAMLRSPAGIGVDLVSLIGAVTDGGPGDNMTNMVIDDDVASNVANDMVQATSAAAPYTKSWLPVFNAPWAVPFFGAPEDPVGNLSRYDGKSTLGTWTILMSDQAAADTGTLNSWSMIVTPVAFACTPFAPASAVTATKTVAGTFSVGGTVTYTVTLTNNGTDGQNDNTGNEFTDTLPATLTLVSASATSGSATTAGNTVNWNGALAPLGGSVTITITATINAGTEGQTISNQGSTSFDGNNDNVNEASNLTDDPGVGGATDPTSFQVAGVAGSPNLSATKTVSGTFAVGGTITYTVTITNSGTAPSVDNVGNEMTDTLPASLTLVSANASSGSATTAGNTVNWNGGIPAGGSVTITITATINAGSQGQTITNQASVSYDSDNNGTNNVTVTSDDPGQGGPNDPTPLVVGAATLTATKSVTGSFTEGGSITYTITLSNSGGSATLDNPGNELTDTLPASLTLVSANASAGLATTAGNTVNWNGSVPAAGSVTITIVATINAGTEGQTVNNQATVIYDADLNGTNETTITSNTASFVVGGISEIPTISEWGMMILALGLLAAAWMVLRRRQQLS